MGANEKDVYKRQYSITAPTPPLTDSSRKTARMMSLAETQGRRAPVSSTLMTRGMGM